MIRVAAIQTTATVDRADNLRTAAAFVGEAADAGAELVGLTAHFSGAAAFTGGTGPAPWEVLLRARAIQNEVFVVAAGQIGELPGGMPACHGHSMIVGPWGTVLAEADD